MRQRSSPVVEHSNINFRVRKPRGTALKDHPIVTLAVTVESSVLGADMTPISPPPLPRIKRRLRSTFPVNCSKGPHVYAAQNEEQDASVPAGSISCVKAMIDAASATSVVNPVSIPNDHVLKCIFSKLSEPEAVTAAIKHLKESDAKLRAVIEMHRGPTFKECESAFLSLVQSIVYQQLATKAANAIFDRLVSLCGGKEGVKPETISTLTVAELRTIGISERKANYLHDLAKNFISGGLSDSTIHLKDDGELMSALTAVKGIGVWSVHMFMIFALHRPDVLPVGDLGVRKGFQKLYKLKSLPTAAEMEEIATCWRPYRSLGSWYMWRLMETKVEGSTSK